MAFTPEQEETLKQIIIAFENGKSISDLPEAEGVNPFEMYTEVVENGDSKKAVLSSFFPYLESECSYGIEFDTTVGNPACARIGNMELHKKLPVQSRMKGCLLDDDGNVVEYLNPSDWTGHTRDGSRGQVMVEIPTHYRKFETEGTKRRVLLSEYPIPGYHVVPKRYVSAYQATIDRVNNKLASVRNFTPQYRGCNNQGEWDGTYRSALGKPACYKSLTEFRTYARNRKSGSSEWNCYTYGTHKAIYWLFVVEYATFNSQAEFNAAKDSNGYAQGGLGDGVTNIVWSQWSGFNGYNPLIDCGTTDELGNRTGNIPFSILKSDGSSIATVSIPRYRGIENPFGHIYQCVDGVLIECGANDDTNLNKLFVTRNPSEFCDIIGNGYAHVGNISRNNGYAKEHIFSDGGDILPSSVGGNKMTYICDYSYTKIPSTGRTTNIVAVGGSAESGNGISGLCCFDLRKEASFHHVTFGSRLCFLKNTD